MGQRSIAIVAASLAWLVAGVPHVVAAAADGPATGTWFDGMEPGVCFDDAWTAEGDFDYSQPAAVVPCEGPHANEVVARIPLGDGDYPAEGLIERVDSECLIEHDRFAGKPIGTSLLSPFNVAPTPEDWEAGVRDALCMVYSDLPMVGTAASGSLRAPGERLAAYREVDGVPDFWLVDAGTGELVKNITDNDLVELLTSPSWTPDGAFIAFSVQAGANDEQSDVYLASVADGSPVRALVGPSAEDALVFSPDGSTVAYIDDVAGTDYDIYIQDLVGGEPTRLTDHADRDSSPQFSPDGSRIVFRRRTDGVSDIWIMNADGSDQQRLTDNGGDNYDPRWSPDGSRIAFTVNLGSNYDIGLMNADGSGQTLLTTHPANDEFPTWSSDGSVIAFHSDRYGGLTLWLMRADGSEPSELTGQGPVGYAMFGPPAED